MDEVAVGDACQTAACVAVPERDRLVRDVPARQHERIDSELGEVGEQKVVKRRVRQHDAELGSAGGDRDRDVCASSARREHDRASGGGEQRPLEIGELDQRRCRRGVAHHQRERAVLAPLARTQLAHGAVVARRAREVVAADPLDRQEGALREPAGGGANGVVFTDRRHPPGAAPAVRTPGRHSAARGSGGRRDRRTRAGTQGTS